jgi:hypothetical protein
LELLSSSSQIQVDIDEVLGIYLHRLSTSHSFKQLEMVKVVEVSLSRKIRLQKDITMQQLILPSFT